MIRVGLHHIVHIEGLAELYIAKNLAQ